MMRHEGRLRANPRMKMPYDPLGRMSEERRAEYRAEAERFLSSPEMSPEPRPITSEPKQRRLL